MADFALGLTKTAVEGTLSRVKSAIEEEEKLKEKVQQDLVFIVGEFQMMQSFLEAAKWDRARNKVASTWVRQLRDLAFEVEDCVEFVVHLDRNSAWWWRVVPSCMAPPRHLDEAAAEIKQLKARVEDVSHRNMRYNLISDSGSHSKIVVPTGQLPAPAATSGPSAFHNLRQVWEAAGKIREMGNLQELIIREDSDLQVISVWGSTGDDLGMTSIFRKAYCDSKICEEFKSRAWVKLMNPFNPDEFLKNLLTQFYESSHQANIDVGHLSKAQLMQQVMEHKYLIIVQEVSTVVEWNAIKVYLPDNKKGSRIVVATQDLGIALLCPGEPYLVSELGRFSGGKSLCAFFKRVYGCQSDMGELKWQIKCRGVISVHGNAPSKSIIVRSLYRSIMYKREQFDGVEFQEHRWVRVVHPFDLVDFSRRLFLDLSSDGFYDQDLEKILHNLDIDPQTEHAIKEVLKMDDQDLTERCRGILRENDCIIVIDGLELRDDWDKIKSTFLSEPIKGCILVITNEECVATHCVDDKNRALNSNFLVNEGLVLSTREEEARDWTNSIEILRSEDIHLDNLLTDHSGVVSVWGIAGVGKSALVKTVYYRIMLGLDPIYRFSEGLRNHPLSRKFTAYIWVDVPHPFSLTEFSRRLLLDFHSHDLQAKETALVGIIEGQDPIQGCRRLLHEHKCLVVIDGMCSRDDWDLIKAAFLSRPITGNIVVITNEVSVATHCVDNKDDFHVVNVKGLYKWAAFELFTEMVASNGKKLAPDEMLQAEPILYKCGGIPKLIVAIGNHSLISSPSFLNSLNDDFIGKLETDPEFHGLRDLFSWMQTYFDACSDSVKPCIFYLSVFSAGHNIRRKRLLRRWVAEGYSRDTFNSTAKENGGKLFSELVSLSIIQHMENLCQVNGLFHEYIISRPMEDNLVFALEGRCGLNSQRGGQHLTIRNNWDRDMNVFESIDFSRLRSLTVFGDWRPFFISTNIKMRLLRVLDLEDTLGVKDDDLDQIAKLLPRLKFLSLRGCREVSRLPNSIGDLRQLQTLDIRHTSIATLPQAIIKLQRLQYIRAGTTKPFDEGAPVTSLPATDEDVTSAIAEDHGEPEATTPAPAEHGDAKAIVTTLVDDVDGMGPNQPATDEEVTPAIAEDHGEPEVTTPAPAEHNDAKATVTTLVDDVDGMGPIQLAAASAAEGVVDTSTRSRRRRHTLLSSWLCKFRERRGLLDNGGVRFPAGFGHLMALQTLGVINVSGVGGKAILKELKKLTQLRKLGLDGVNQENWKEFCSVISGHGHLESLSVHVDKDKEEQGFLCCFDDISLPPMTLKSLKLQGHVRTLPGWVKQHPNLKKLDLEMTIFSQGDIQVLDDVGQNILQRLLVRLVQDGELHIAPPGHYLGMHLKVLQIDCTSRLQLTFGPFIGGYVELVLIHCSSGSSLQISGLGNLQCLQEVWLKGSYSNALKKDLQQQLSEYPREGKPVLKLVQPRSS